MSNSSPIDLIPQNRHETTPEVMPATFGSSDRILQITQKVNPRTLMRTMHSTALATSGPTKSSSQMLAMTSAALPARSLVCWSSSERSCTHRNLVIQRSHRSREKPSLPVKTSPPRAMVP